MVWLRSRSSAGWRKDWTAGTVLFQSGSGIIVAVGRVRVHHRLRRPRLTSRQEHPECTLHAAMRDKQGSCYSDACPPRKTA